MKKRTRMSIFMIFMMIISIFSIGFATWIISFDKNFDANYTPQADVNINNLHNQKLTYNGLNQFPITTPIDNVLKDYTLSITKDGVVVNNTKDAGNYIFTYTSNKQNFDPFTINFVIEPITVDVTFTVTYNGNSKEYVNNYDIKHYDIFVADATKKVGISAKISGVLANDVVNVDFKKGDLPAGDFDFGKKETFNLSISGQDAHNYKLRQNIVSVVAKQKLILKNTTFEKNYDGTLATAAISSTQSFIINEFKNNHLYHEDGVTPFTNAITTRVNYMHNGAYLYGTAPSNLGFTPGVCESTKMIGSTYLVNLLFADPRFEVYKDGQTTPLTEVDVYFKYKTAKVGGTYYTIEDAITNVTGDIILEGDVTNATSFVVTSFSGVLFDKTYNIDHRRILLPYDANKNDDYINAWDKDAATTYVNVYSALYIPKNITVNLNNQTNVIVSAVVKFGGEVSRKSVIMNDGIININSMSKISSYGFTKGKGIINIYPTGEVIDVFRIRDWPGADEAVTLKNQNAFPVLNWSVSNITCSTKVYKEGKYNAMTYIVAVSGLVKLNVTDVYIVGDSNTPNCLFKPNSGSSEDFVLKNVKINNDKYTLDNQVKGYKTELIINGKFKDSTLKLNADAGWLGNFTFETSTAMAVPISNFDFVLNANTKLILSASSYMLYENSSFLIHSGAQVDVNGNAFLYSLNNSKIIVNGRLSGTGSISNVDVTKQKVDGKPFETNTKGAIIDVSNFNVPKCVIKTGVKTSMTINGETSGYVDANYTINKFNNGNAYISMGTNPYYFVPLSATNQFNVDMVIDGVTTRKSFNSFENTFTLDLSALDKPSKKYYDFENWYLDNSYNTPFSSHTFTTSGEVITIYAKHVPHIYNINYYFSYNDEVLTDLSGINGDKSTIFFTFDGTNFIYWTDPNNKSQPLNKITLPSGYTYTMQDGTVKHEEKGWHVGVPGSVLSDQTITELTTEQFKQWNDTVGDQYLPLTKKFCDYIVTVMAEGNVKTEIGIPAGQPITIIQNEIHAFANGFNNDVDYKFKYNSFTYNGQTYQLNDPTTWNIIVNSDITINLDATIKTYNVTFKLSKYTDSGDKRRLKFIDPNSKTEKIIYGDTTIENIKHGTYNFNFIAEKKAVLGIKYKQIAIYKIEYNGEILTEQNNGQLEITINKSADIIVHA